MADRHHEPSGGSMDSIESDATRWDERYTGATHSAHVEPPEILRLVSDSVTRSTKALDLACGFGDGGLFVAQLGAEVTCADVSGVALEAVEARADTHGIDLRTLRLDLLEDELPEGPWDLVSCVHFLDRSLLSRIGDSLAPQGLLVVAVATTVNLERHARPSARFLLRPDELPTLTPGLGIVHHDEEWRTNGVHEAWMIAAKP